MSGILASFSRGGGTLPELLLNITNTASPNIPTLLANAGWKGVRQPVRLLNTALVNTLVIPSSLAGADITIENQSGARIGGVRGGGTALRTQVPIKVDNQGIISGGGGRGEYGGSVDAWYKPPKFESAWFNATPPGPGRGEGFLDASSLTIASREIPAAGGVRSIGQTAAPYEPRFGAFTISVTTGTSGDGGQWGQKGGIGSDALPSFSATGQGWSNNPDFDPVASVQLTLRSRGGATEAGYYIDGNSLVTWINTGTRLGRVKA